MKTVLHERTREQDQKILASRVYAWMQRNWKRHLGDDLVLDIESLAEQAAYEFVCPRELADELAVEFRKSIESEEETEDA